MSVFSYSNDGFRDGIGKSRLVGGGVFRVTEEPDLSDKNPMPPDATIVGRQVERCETPSSDSIDDSLPL